MAKKKARKKSLGAVAKNVEGKASTDPVETTVENPKVEAVAESKPAPAIVDEPIMKVMENGQATYFTKTEYDKKYGGQEAK